MENKKSQKELIDYAAQLADKHAELKAVVTKILDEMDKIELEYLKVKEEIKNS
jgi:hypothetical protein